MSEWPQNATEEQVEIAEEIKRRFESLEDLARELYEALKYQANCCDGKCPRAYERAAVMTRYECEVGE